MPQQLAAPTNHQTFMGALRLYRVCRACFAAVKPLAWNSLFGRQVPPLCCAHGWCDEVATMLDLAAALRQDAASDIMTTKLDRQN